MRIPPFERFSKGLQMLGVLIVGMVIGAAILNSVYLTQFEALVSLKGELEMKLEQYESDIEMLNRYKEQHTVIKSVQPRITVEARQGAAKPELDKLTEKELLKRIKEDLSSFLGQSIFEIDSDAKLARKLLERKIYTDVYEKDYTIEVKTVLVVENVLHAWVEVRYYAKQPSS